MRRIVAIAGVCLCVGAIHCACVATVSAQEPVTATVPLVAGWNLVSLPLAPASSAITVALASIQGHYTLVYGYDASDVAQPWHKYDAAAPPFLNTLTQVDERMGLWVRASEPVSLVVSGSLASSPSITLTRGWNLVGYPLTQPQSITVALESIAGQYDLVYAYRAADASDPWKKYHVAAPPALNDLAEMIPGEGYWLRASTDCVWRPAQAARAWPDSSARILVFNDQINTHDLTEAQWQFAATHYVGAQKLVREATRHLRRYNPGFLVLHYRLGQALGHSIPDACRPTTDYLRILSGDEWVVEWPGDANVQESWFYHWQSSRVFNCDYGHYLMALDDPGWRAWWSAQVMAQLQNNENDGLFADSFSVPNYGFRWNPSLPVVNAAFESAWAAREHAFTDSMRAQFAGRWKWIPNVGAWITTRDPSDYSNVDGVMAEGFAEWGGGEYFALEDWELQMNRLLPLVLAGKILIAQTYPSADDVQERLFVLGSYLLMKGRYTYINLETSTSVEWFPEYDLDLDLALDELPTTISAYLDPTWGVYVRRYAHGLVLVNPTDSARDISLGATLYRVTPSGGGEVTESGIAAGSLTYQPASALSLAPYSAAILLNQAP